MRRDTWQNTISTNEWSPVEIKRLYKLRVCVIININAIPRILHELDDN